MTQRTKPTYPALPVDPADASDIAALLSVGTTDGAANTNAKDVTGNKVDAAVTTVGTTKSLMAYLKGILNKITVPGADATANGFVNDVAGNKTDAAVYAAAATKSLMAYLKGVLGIEVLATGTFTTSSATVPADTGRTEGTGYWKGSILLPLTGAAAMQPRYIAGFAVTTGIFTVDAENPFTAATGTVAYAILRGNVGQTIPTADGTNNMMIGHVVGNKADAAVLAPAATKSLVGYAKGILELTQKCTPAVEKHIAGTLWTIAGGPIRVDAIIGRVSTGIEATAATPKLQFTPTGGSATDICADSSTLSGKAAETLLGVDGVKATALQICSDAGIGLPALSAHMPVYLGTGIVTYVADGAAISTGRIQWTLIYTPLDPNVTVT